MVQNIGNRSAIPIDGSDDIHRYPTTEIDHEHERHVLQQATISPTEDRSFIRIVSHDVYAACRTMNVKKNDSIRDRQRDTWHHGDDDQRVDLVVQLETGHETVLEENNGAAHCCGWQRTYRETRCKGR